MKILLQKRGIEITATGHNGEIIANGVSFAVVLVGVGLFGYLLLKAI